MNLLTLTTYILLSIIANCQTNITEECRAIYDENLEIYAIDVCTINTLLNPELPINQRYVCKNDEVYSQYWFNTDGCVGNPDSEPRVDTDNAVCDGLSNCPYAIIRVYEYKNNCEDYGLWSDRAIIMNACELSTNTSDDIGSLKLECDSNNGVTRNTYSGDDCNGDLIEQSITYPASGNYTCVINNDGVMARFVSCNERSNATTPIPAPTKEPTAPTPKPTAGGTVTPSISPTQPTSAPTPDTTDDTWFITALVFICLFGVLLCGILCLGYTVVNQEPTGRKIYNRAPTDEEAGVETTNYN